MTTPLRELVVASAGSGKTFQLSSRMVGLLALGVPPDEILASTFTRKAAGEILERVLRRLAAAALDPKAAAELADSLPDWAPRERMRDPEACRSLLAGLAGRLHLLQVYTLDAFFHRAVRAFALEIGLTGRWSVADEAATERVRMRAISRTIEALGPEEMARILQAVGKGKVSAAVHRALLGEVASLHAEYRSLAPGTSDPWGFAGGPGRFSEPDPESWRRAAAALDTIELPRNKGNGQVPANWQRNIDGARASLLEMDRSGLRGNGLVKRVLEGGDHFDRHPIPVELVVLLEEIGSEIRDWELELLDRRARETGAFIERYHAEVLQLRRQEGAYEFDDLPFALLEGGTDPMALYYRLDGEIRHLLLDEFQDTSVVQWRALEPMVGEILAGYEEERAVYLVGDPKQSIYGWRGGEPRILEAIGERYALPRSSLEKSWRSSPVVLDLVNRVFGTLAGNPAFERDEEVDAAASWLRGFEPHHAHFTDRAGHWQVDVIDDEDDALLVEAAERAAWLHHQMPGATIGILTRTRKDGARILAHLRAHGIEVSGEGGVPMTDSAPVLAILALLRMVDHPGDRTSRYLVGHTALGALVGLDDWASDADARQVATRLRRQLIEEGYGPVVGGWVRHLLPSEEPRDRTRLRQLAELAAEWEERATLRTMDFVRQVERERRELPGGAAVRIMTIHASKGLQFDLVVIPERGKSWRGGPPHAILGHRPDPAGPVERLVPAVPREFRDAVPEAARAARDAEMASLRDDISGLYVAITRARHAVHILIPADGKGIATGLSGALVLRNALGEPGTRATDGMRWAAGGHADWWEGDDPELEILRTPPSPPVEGGRPRVRLAEPRKRRLLERTTPSGLEGGDRVPLERVLRRPALRARERGTAFHRWLEAIEWLPEGGVDALDRDALLALHPDPELLDILLDALRRPEVAHWLERSAWPEGTTVRREFPFAYREDGQLVRGIADRVLRTPDDRVVVVDWKSDTVPDEAFYAPQIDAYRRAMARAEGVPLERVEGELVFLAPAS